MTGTPARSDAEFVHAAQRGDAAALGALLERYRAPLYALALSILGDRGQAQDAVQDAFLVALQRLGELREPAAAGAWLRMVTRNAALMQLRRKRDTPVGIADVPAGNVESEVEVALDRLVLRDWVWTALDQLPEELRTTVMLRFFTRQRSYAQIAAILGIPIGTVRSRLNYGKRRLADALLETVAGEYHDHRALVQRRWQERANAVDEMHRHGTAAGYFADCERDVHIHNAALGYHVRGTAGERCNLEQGLAIGVRMRLTGVVASPGITIIEADYRNPPEHPTHCPPAHTEIRIHDRGVTTQVILHFGQLP